MARLIGPRVQESVGQPVVIDNISGAGGSIGISRLSRMPGAGHSMGLGHTATLGMSIHLFKNVGHDAEAKFTAIGQMRSRSSVLDAGEGGHGARSVPRKRGRDDGSAGRHPAVRVRRTRHLAAVAALRQAACAPGHRTNPAPAAARCRLCRRNGWEL